MFIHWIKWCYQSIWRACCPLWSTRPLWWLLWRWQLHYEQWRSCEKSRWIYAAQLSISLVCQFWSGRKSSKWIALEKGPIVICFVRTLSSNSTAMVLKPMTASQVRVSWMYSKTAFHVCTKPSASKLRPSRLFTWVVAMLKAAALVKPPTTGSDMKSTRKPYKKNNISWYSRNIWRGPYLDLVSPMRGRWCRWKTSRQSLLGAREPLKSRRWSVPSEQWDRWWSLECCRGACTWNNPCRQRTVRTERDENENVNNITSLASEF